MPAEKIGSIKIDINGFKCTQFANLVKHFAEIGKNSFQVPTRNHVQFRTGSREMVDATIEAAIAGELTQWRKANLAGFATIGRGLCPHAVNHAQNLGAGLLDH